MSTCAVSALHIVDSFTNVLSAAELDTLVWLLCFATPGREQTFAQEGKAVLGLAVCGNPLGMGSLHQSQHLADGMLTAKLCDSH